MSRITDLTSLAGGAGPTTNSSQQRPLTARGQVAQAPASEASPMSVTITSVTRQFGVTIPAGNWTPRGKTLPAVGAECLVVFDDVGDAFVPVWAGTTSLPPSGSAAGAGSDLLGNFPSPQVNWGGSGRLAWAAPAKCYRNAAYTTVNGWNNGYFDTVAFDPGSNLDNSSGTLLYKVPATGYYQLTCRFGCNSTLRVLPEFDTMTSLGVVIAAIVDGVDITPGAGGTPAATASSVEYLTAGTRVCARVFVGGIGGLYTGAAATFFSVVRVA